ncbi:hypothetical protein [Trueperella pecoris]|uniref:hypothetical protein n=1 Tax=Trueperella pecoris TaxID=2733571 RepID=UPI001ABEA06C|nr:hypothetical protein [Trueperella pecoris]QTG75815.1 hypothetical protein J4179_01715 [Trueperella pecoris]
MRHQLNLDLATREKVVGLRRVALRERLTRLILGEPKEFTLVVPGDSVDQVTITQHGDDDDLMALARAVGVTRSGGDAA